MIRPKRPDPSTAWSLLLSAVILSVTLLYPLNNDNALYAFMGDLLLMGHLPYIGSWDQNFPGIVPIHASQILLLGKSQIAFRIFDILLQLTTCYLSMRLARRYGGVHAAMLAPVVVALYFVHQGFWMAGERDTYVTLLLLLSMDLVTRRSSPRPAFLLAGCAMGAALLIRPTYALAAAAPIYFILGNHGRGIEWRYVGRYFLGVLAPWAITLLVYAAAGGLTEFYVATISFNTEVYLGQGSVFDLWEPVRFYVLATVVASLGLWHVARRRELPFLGYWLVSFLGALLSLLALYRHSVYHYHPAMVLLLVMSAIGWAVIIDEVGRRLLPPWSRLLKTTVVVLVILYSGFQAVRGNTIQHLLRQFAAGRISTLAEAYAMFEPSPEFGYQVQQRLARYLKQRSAPGEAVQMFGPYSYPQYAAHLATASRFQTLHALVMRKEGAPLTTFQIRWRAEYLATMESVRPQYFIVCDGPPAFRQFYAGRLGHEILQHDFAELSDWLSTNYQADTVIGAFTVYQRVHD